MLLLHTRVQSVKPAHKPDQDSYNLAVRMTRASLADFLSACCAAKEWPFGGYKHCTLQCMRTRQEPDTESPAPGVFLQLYFWQRGSCDECLRAPTIGNKVFLNRDQCNVTYESYTAKQAASHLQREGRQFHQAIEV